MSECQRTFLAVVVGDRAYLVDFGPGVVRQASAAYFNGVDALRPDLLTVAFCTHLHTDHTAGYPDLILLRGCWSARFH